MKPAAILGGAEKVYEVSTSTERGHKPRPNMFPSGVCSLRYGVLSSLRQHAIECSVPQYPVVSGLSESKSAYCI